MPAFSLGDAREAARAARRAVAEARDPAAEKRHARGDTSTLCAEVTRLFIERDQRPENRTWKETVRLLGLRPDEDRLTPVRGGSVDQWSGRHIEDIRRRNVIAVLDALSDKPATKQNTFAALRRLYARIAGGAPPNGALSPLPPRPTGMHAANHARLTARLIRVQAQVVGRLGTWLETLQIDEQRTPQLKSRESAVQTGGSVLNAARSAPGSSAAAALLSAVSCV